MTAVYTVALKNKIMALDLDTIKTIQGLITEMNTTATFLSKLREAKEISFTVSGITTKVNAKTDQDAYQALYDSLSQSSDKKLSTLRDSINKLLYNDSEIKVEEKV